MTTESLTTEYLKSIDFIEKTILDGLEDFNPEQLVGSIHGIPVGLFVGSYPRPDPTSEVAKQSYYPTLMSGGGSDIQECKWCPEELFDSLFQKVSTKNSKRKTRKTRK